MDIGYTELVHFLKTNTVPIFFVSPTHFNLMGIDHWVGHWVNINFLSLYDSEMPNILVPQTAGSPVFESMEDLNKYLLEHYEVTRVIQDVANQSPHAMFLFFNTAIEDVCRDMHLTPLVNSFDIVHRVDSKVETTKIGNSVGVHSVPNLLIQITSYDDLVDQATQAGLGTQWVIQLPYGDSGKTTFFINNREDFDTNSDAILSQPLVKVMKRIRCVGSAIEACATRWGTFVGPLMRELIGEPSLTPYPGGWCGNDLSATGFNPSIRHTIHDMTRRLGDALYTTGYRGYFEVDYLIDRDTECVYLGELNPRISGVTALTNTSPFAQRTIPLFLFHLAEFLNFPKTLDPTAFNTESVSHGAADPCAQFILKHTDDDLRVIVSAPKSGIYTWVDGKFLWDRVAVSFHETKQDELFVLRIMNSGDYAYHGADLAICFFRGELFDHSHQLSPDGSRWIERVKREFVMRDLTTDEEAMIERQANPGLTLKGGANG